MTPPRGNPAGPPSSGAIRGFTPSTLLSGAVVPVARYNVFSRTSVAIANKVLGTPRGGYVEEFAFARPPRSVPDTMRPFLRVADISGVKMREIAIRPGEHFSLGRRMYADQSKKSNTPKDCQM